MAANTSLNRFESLVADVRVRLTEGTLSEDYILPLLFALQVGKEAPRVEPVAERIVWKVHEEHAKRLRFRLDCARRGYSDKQIPLFALYSAFARRRPSLYRSVEQAMETSLQTLCRMREEDARRTFFSSGYEELLALLAEYGLRFDMPVSELVEAFHVNSIPGMFGNKEV